MCAARLTARSGLVPSLSRAQLKGIVDWGQVGTASGDLVGLGQFVLRGKFQSLRYFLNVEDLSWFRANDPFGNHHIAVKQADAILAGDIPLAGLEAVACGTEIDWNKDPVSGEPIWRNLGAIRPRRDLDTRFWVELNLHRHFLPVARAGLITGDPRYGAYIRAQWSQWLHSNPPIDEEYISDGLELGLRVVVWTHCLYLLGEQFLGPREALRMLALVARYGALVERQCLENTNRNNHLVAEAFGLFFIGLMYPELEPAARWRETGLSVLSDAAAEQFTADGVHREQALGYQLFVTEFLLATVQLASRNGIAIPPQISDCLRACATYLAHLVRSDGSFPSYGDEGMPFFSPTGCTRVEPLRIASLLEGVLDPDVPSAGDNPWREEVFWWSGRRQAARSVDAHIDHAQTPTVKEFSGHVVLANAQAHVHFDCSRHGLGKRAGHGHDDALHLDYFAHGITWLADAGTYTYLRNGPYREYFAGAHGHSGVLYDGHGAGVMVKTGSFGWLRKAHAEVSAFGQESGFLWARGRHLGVEDNGELWFPALERFVVLTSKGWLLVIDSCADRSGTIDSIWHLHPQLTPDRNTTDPTFYADGKTLRFFTAGSGPQQISLHHGDDPELPGWYSPAYGLREPTWVLRTRAQANKDFWRATLWMPSSVPSGRIAFDVTPENSGELVCTIQEGADRHVFNVDRGECSISTVEKVY